MKTFQEKSRSGFYASDQKKLEITLKKSAGYMYYVACSIMDCSSV